MSRLHHFGGIAVIATLSACGGGGDDAPAARYTQSDIKHVATIGLVTNVFARSDVAPGIAFLEAIVEGLAVTTSAAAGTKVNSPITCPGGSGTIGSTVVKSDAHAGLRSGDQVIFAFSKCNFGTAGIVADGTAKLTMKGTIAPPLSNNLSGLFDADLTGYTFARGGRSVTYTGVVSATVMSNASNDTFNVKASFPASPGLTASMTNGSTPFRVSFLTGATFDVTGSLGSDGGASKVDGDVISGPIAALISLKIGTPTPVSGPVPASGTPFVATAGVVNAKVTAANGLAGNTPQTSLTLNGNSATVSGDADLDGSMETVFNATWAELMSL